MPHRRIDPAAGQERQRALQGVREAADRERLHARGGKLDRERQPVETLAYRDDRSSVGGEGRIARGGALDEEFGRGGVRERSDRPFVLPPQTQSPPTGDDHPDGGALREHVGQQWCRESEMFEVVQYEQGVRRTELPLESVVRTGLSGRERSQDRGFDKGWVAHRREVDEAHAVGETAFGPLRDRQRHARFADASHPGKRQQTNVGAEELFVERGDLAVATNEWRWLRRELSGHGDRPSLRG